MSLDLLSTGDFSVCLSVRQSPRPFPGVQQSRCAAEPGAMGSAAPSPHPDGRDAAVQSLVFGRRLISNRSISPLPLLLPPLFADQSLMGLTVACALAGSQHLPQLVLCAVRACASVSRHWAERMGPADPIWFEFSNTISHCEKEKEFGCDVQPGVLRMTRQQRHLAMSCER